jgi:hypothetical protein
MTDADIEQKARLYGVWAIPGQPTGRSVEHNAGIIQLCRALLTHPQQPAPLDCRTCRNHTTASGGCISVLRCIDGSAYQRAGVRQCFESGIVPAPTTDKEPRK